MHVALSVLIFSAPVHAYFLRSPGCLVERHRLKPSLDVQWDVQEGDQPEPIRTRVPGLTGGHWRLVPGKRKRTSVHAEAGAEAGRVVWKSVLELKWRERAITQTSICQVHNASNLSPNHLPFFPNSYALLLERDKALGGSVASRLIHSVPHRFLFYSHRRRRRGGVLPCFLPPLILFFLLLPFSFPRLR